MTKQLILVTAGAALLATYFFLRKKYGAPDKYLQSKSNLNPHRHHLTKVFANAKKYAMNQPL